MITIFTDGSSRGNPGPGGWAAVVVKGKGTTNKDKGTATTGNAGMYIIELGGGERSTTNNRMELTAAFEGLSKVSDIRGNIRDGSEMISIYCDSSYVINGITKWVQGWKKNGWKTKTKGDVLNRDLWMKLDDLAAGISSGGAQKISWKYVGGHVGIVGNERCDHIATAFADGMKIRLYEGPLANYDLPNILDIKHDETSLAIKRAQSAHSSAKAYSYLSSIGGIIEVHHSWAECEKRVKGKRGAKYRKAISADDERRIIAEFEAL